MKRRVYALLLVLVLMMTMTLSITAAEPRGKDTATLVLHAQQAAGETVVTVSLKGGKGVTNGRIAVQYDPCLAAYAGVQFDADAGMTSVNGETEGTVSVAWIGSSLPQKETALFRLTFRRTGAGDVPYTASAAELYAGETKLTAEDASVVAADNPFKDVENHWAKEEILKVYHAGLFNGTDDKHFSPEKPIDRGMIVMVLYRMAGCPEVTDLSNPYDDVDEGEYYAAAVAWASQEGIVEGIGSKHFAPNKHVDRQELATMLYRYTEWMDGDVSGRADLSVYKDAKRIADWARNAMSWAVDAGILKGHTNGQLKPTGGTTRAEAAVMVCRYAEL